jgi:hypothetical protein
MEMVRQTMEMNSWARCLLKPQQIQQELSLTYEDRLAYESNKWAAYFNQQPANHQAEVRSYILYAYTINIHIKD